MALHRQQAQGQSLAVLRSWMMATLLQFSIESQGDIGHVPFMNRLNAVCARACVCVCLCVCVCVCAERKVGKGKGFGGEGFGGESWLLYFVFRHERIFPKQGAAQTNIVLGKITV